MVGQPALDWVRQSPPEQREKLNAALVRSVKRMIGQPPPGGLLSNGHPTTPIEVSAAILAKLARDASARLGFSVHSAVITVPAHFGDRERSATQMAAEMAGLQVLQIVNEPSAAALTYYQGHAKIQGTALVFDLGGGTFDVSVLHISPDEMTVVATEGIEKLGGVNFTDRLAEELQKRYTKETGAAYPQDSAAQDLLLMIAEQTKCRLSSEETVVARLAPANSPQTAITFTRREFERLIRFDIGRLQIAVEMVLDRAQKTAQQIDRVLLCGGSSRIPAIQTMLAELFGYAPEHTLDLDLSVAFGAAYLAAQHEQKATRTAGLQVLPGILIDCITYAVGIEALNVSATSLTKLVMLHPGDALENWSSPFPVLLAQTGRDFPPIGVYKGESPELLPEDYLGDIVLTIPAGIPQGARANIRMKQDQSGIVQVQLDINGTILPGYLKRQTNARS